MLTPEQVKKLNPGDKCIAEMNFVSASKSSILFEMPGMELIEISQRNRDCLSLPSEYTRIYFPEVMCNHLTPDEKTNLISFLHDYAVDLRRKNELRNSLKKVGIDLGNSQPKHDPTRLFKKGDIVEPVERWGRKLRIEPGQYEVESDEIDNRVTLRHLETKFSHAAIDTVYLELVTPVEEQEPYSITDNLYGWIVYEGNPGNVVANFNNTHPRAKEAAQAECARLNAEWRKEQEK